jgi:hypothetical protein
MNVTNETMEQPFVDCGLYYPANAGTSQVGMTESVDANGKGCHRDEKAVFQKKKVVLSCTTLTAPMTQVKSRHT